MIEALASWLATAPTASLQEARIIIKGTIALAGTGDHEVRLAVTQATPVLASQPALHAAYGERSATNDPDKSLMQVGDAHLTTCASSLKTRAHSEVPD